MIRRHFQILRTFYLLNSLLFSMTLLSTRLSAQTPIPTLGVVGDSLALGAATHPALSLELRELTKIMMGEISVKAKEDERLYKFNIKGELASPLILWPGIRDYFGSTDWVYSHLMDSFSHTFFSTPQYSWSYMVPRSLNVEAKSILLAAELGAKVDNIPRQVDRLLNANKNELPASLFIFFSASDLCASTMNGITSAEDFGNSLLSGLQYLARNGNASAEGTKVYVPHFLPLAQLLTKESILSYNMTYSGEKTTCRELRKNAFQAKKIDSSENLPVEALYLSAFLPPNYANKCPTLFNHEFLASNQVSFLSNFNAKKKQAEIVQLSHDYLSLVATRIRNYRIETDKAVAKANEWLAKTMPRKKITFLVIRDTADISLEGEDLAPDCFHLNINGQIKVADAIIGGISKK